MNPIQEAYTQIEKHNYNSAIYTLVTDLLPSPPDKKDVSTNQKFQTLLLDTYAQSNKLLLRSPYKKATYLYVIASCLNSQMCSTFTPELIKNVRVCLNYQTIASAYINKSFRVFRKSGIELPFEKVSDLNYLLNVIDLNLYIIMIANKGVIYNDKELYNALRVVSDRMSALIKKDPRPEYYKTQSLLYTYMDSVVAAKRAIRYSLQAASMKENFGNIDAIGYRLRYKGKSHPVIIYQ